MAKRNEIMNISRSDWQPGFGEIFTWFAMDKNGKIAVMVNNCWGNIPKVILQKENPENELDMINEYIWEESSEFFNYPKNKMGKTKLDMYSHLAYADFLDRTAVENWVDDRSKYNGELREYSLPAIKGLFVFYAVEGSKPNEDFPVGCNIKTEMGDYYSFLVPTIYGKIDDFPERLKKIIAVSDSLDFRIDKIIKNDQINVHFTRLAA